MQGNVSNFIKFHRLRLGRRSLTSLLCMHFRIFPNAYRTNTTGWWLRGFNIIVLMYQTIKRLNASQVVELFPLGLSVAVRPSRCWPRDEELMNQNQPVMLNRPNGSITPRERIMSVAGVERTISTAILNSLLMEGFFVVALSPGCSVVTVRNCLNIV